MYNIENLNKELKNQLDQQQFTIATTRTETGYRRVKGPAGSGKSLALAGRAAMLACEGKRVLVCSYNITLYNYLESLVEGLIPQEVSRQITFTNFHYWCRNVCKSTGYLPVYKNLERAYTRKSYNGIEYLDPEFWKEPVAELVSKLYEAPDTLNLPTYDAILVDEGQDYRISWWQTLRKAVVQGGEMLLVADKTQNIHDTAQAWTDMEMNKCGFTGPWFALSESYRLPAKMIPILEDFSKRFPYDAEIDIPPPKTAEQTDLFDEFRWVQVPPGKLPVDVCIEEVERLHNEPSVQTVYFLSEKDIGIPVVNKFKQRGIDILDTHSKDQHRSRNKKVGLHPGCAEICATTVHSFKGWEAPHLVVHVDRINTDKDRALFYTALSRLHKHSKGTALTVVSSCPDPELEQFGRDHFDNPNSASLGAFSPNIVEVNDIPF